MNSYTFTAREDDGTGLYYYRARYYHPALGRFVGEDPLGMAGGANVYAYVHNRPINAIDPLGWSDWNAPPVGVTGRGPLLPGPGQAPPGYNPNWPNGIGDPAAGERPFPYTQDPTTGRKYWPDPEDSGHWPHYHWKDPDGTKGRYPENCEKPWPTQKQPPYGDQSPTDPWPKAPVRPWWGVPPILWPPFLVPILLPPGYWPIAPSGGGSA